MAIVSVRCMFTGRGGAKDFKHKIRYNLVYEVVTDNPADNEELVAGDLAIDPVTSVKVPVHGDVHPGNPRAVVTDSNPEQSDESFYIWYVTISYDTHPDTPSVQDPSAASPTGDGDKPGEWPLDPTQEKAKWEIGTITKQEPVTQWREVDWDGDIIVVTPDAWVANTPYKIGNMITNQGNVYIAKTSGTSSVTLGAGPTEEGKNIVDGLSGLTWSFSSTVLQIQNDPKYILLTACQNTGGLPFDPPYMIDVSIPTIRVTKNIPVATIDYCLAIKDAVSSEPWKGAPARCAKVLEFTASSAETKNGFVYVAATWLIGLDPDTWDVRLLDAGYGYSEEVMVANPAAPPDRIAKKVFTRFKDAAGEFIGSAVPMDGEGGQLNPGDEPVFLRGIPRQMRLIDFNEVIPF